MVERLVIRHLYGRMMDTLLATWGLSLLFVGAATTVFGASSIGLSTDFANVAIGGMSVSSYNLTICAFSLALVALCWWLAVRTKAGLIVRGTMQAPEMASCLGVDRNRVYMATFGLGSCLAGLAGAALAPLTGVSPAMGGFFVAKAFITVIVGGHLPLVGASAASTLRRDRWRGVPRLQLRAGRGHDADRRCPAAAHAAAGHHRPHEARYLA